MPEYVGAVHLHSCYSDGSGTVREITAAARRAGLDFVVLTDHDTLRPAEDRWDGWHDGVLVVVGVEVTCQFRSHIVVFGAREVAALRFKPLRRVLFDLQNQGAVAFVAHAQPAHIMGYSMKAGELTDWEVAGFAGVELWSFMHDICDGMAPWRIPSFIRNWPQRVRGPNATTVAHWDRVTAWRRFPAVGSLDNHAFIVPGLGAAILSYDDGFRTLRTHVLAQECTGRRDDARLITDTLCRGRAFIALDMLADARGFRFFSESTAALVLRSEEASLLRRVASRRIRPIPQNEADAGGQRLEMGDEAPYAGPAVLEVRSPVEAKLTLLRAGRPVAETVGTALRHTAAEPGVYRAEARLGGKPWVYTNPIYLWANV